MELPNGFENKQKLTTNAINNNVYRRKWRIVLFNSILNEIAMSSRVA